jgi:hypothetical protein
MPKNPLGLSLQNNYLEQKRHEFIQGRVLFINDRIAKKEILIERRNQWQIKYIG